MTLREVLTQGTRCLSPSTETPRLDASLLLAEVLHTNRPGLLLGAENPVSAADQERYEGLLQRRLGGECVAYILGRKEFRGLEFILSPAVLVPRPDTETLVEAALSAIDRLSSPETCRVLDLGTGSGAVGIALKHERPGITVYASDLSPAALEVAQCNARLLLGGTILFIESNLFDRIEGTFTLITANLPYIPSRQIETLAPEVQQEPRMSLDGGEDGLEILRKLILEAQDHLRPGGILLMEADPGQMSILRELLTAQDYQDIQSYPDLSGQLRVISARA